MRMRALGAGLVLAAGLAVAASLASAQPSPTGVNDAAITSEGLPRLLSEYRFFSGAGTRSPSPVLTGYRLRTPLFSDYADKQRFIYLPPGETAEVYGSGEVRIPIGGAIIKTFGYGEGDDFRPLETRVLLHRATGWEAVAYVWKPDLSDAEIKIAGMRIPVTVTKPSGKRVAISYAVPNRNQCKECHGFVGRVKPIGTRYSNMEFSNRGAPKRMRMPHNILTPNAPIWNDPASGSLDERARAYLAVNCAHCHNQHGSASNSGLFLGLSWQDYPVQTGIYKRPVAAGRGSGGHDFAIAPGDPDRSIMVHRMSSTEPGVAMPEVGRSLVHDEGVALIREWIASLPAK